MSESSLWLVKKDFSGEEAFEYPNSWLVAPVVFNAMIKKYTGSDMDFIIAFGSDESFFKNLNHSLNRSENQVDRVLWELVNQQGFYSKDKLFVADCIRSFFKGNAEYIGKDSYDILERFLQLAEEIESIDEEENTLFIFKNTSVDDGVVSLFQRYNEEEEKYVSCKLTDNPDKLFGTSIIEDNQIVGFRRISDMV